MLRDKVCSGEDEQGIRVCKRLGEVGRGGGGGWVAIKQTEPLGAFTLEGKCHCILEIRQENTAEFQPVNLGHLKPTQL